MLESLQLVCPLRMYDSDWRAGLVVMLRHQAKKLKPDLTSPHNHSAHTNKVWDHFCKCKWFGVSKWVWEHSWMPMFMSEGHMEVDVSAARPFFQPNNQICCRDVQLRYFPSAEQTQGSLWLYMFISSNTKPTAHWASLYSSYQRSSHLLAVLQLLAMVVIILLLIILSLL